MELREKKGLTLISLVIYIIALMIAMMIIGTFIRNTNKNIIISNDTSSMITSINELHMYMLEETSLENNNIVKKDTNGKYIEFASGNKYHYSNHNLYKNKVIILRNLDNCEFILDEDFRNLAVNLSFKNEALNKTLNYVIGDSRKYI